MYRSLLIPVAMLGAVFCSTGAVLADRYPNHTVRVYTSPDCKPGVVTQAAARPSTEVTKTAYVPIARTARFQRPSVQPPRISQAEVSVGATVTARLNFLGESQGYVLLKMGSATLQCQISAWSSDEVRFTVPDMGLVQPTAAELQLVRPTGTIIKSYAIKLISKPELLVEESPAPSPPASELATEITAATNGLVMSGPIGSVQTVSTSD